MTQEGVKNAWVQRNVPHLHAEMRHQRLGCRGFLEEESQQILGANWLLSQLRHPTQAFGPMVLKNP
jgi:hypothetical protein